RPVPAGTPPSPTLSSLSALSGTSLSVLLPQATEIEPPPPRLRRAAARHREEPTRDEESTIHHNGAAPSRPVLLVLCSVASRSPARARPPRETGAGFLFPDFGGIPHGRLEEAGQARAIVRRPHRREGNQDHQRRDLCRRAR